MFFSQLNACVRTSTNALGEMKQCVRMCVYSVKVNESNTTLSHYFTLFNSHPSPYDLAINPSDST